MVSEQSLTLNALYIWCVNTENINDQKLLQQYATILSPTEREKQQRFIRAQDRHRYLVTRALVRTSLSRFANVRPSDWTFYENDYGRPFIDSRHDCAHTLFFNVSHSGDWVVLAVGSAPDIGIDVEDCRRGAPLQLADAYFARAEVLALRRLPEQNQVVRFFELWTLKESYIKARGLGLSLALDSFAFDLREQGRLMLNCDPECDRRPEDWSFLLSHIDENHLMALCFSGTHMHLTNIVCMKSTPLLNESGFSPIIVRQTTSMAMRIVAPTSD